MGSVIPMRIQSSVPLIAEGPLEVWWSSAAPHVAVASMTEVARPNQQGSWPVQVPVMVGRRSPVVR